MNLYWQGYLHTLSCVNSNILATCSLFSSQDFCSNTTSWPPLSALQVVRADVTSSCKTACQKQGLICEPAFFPHLNSAQSLAK